MFGISFWVIKSGRHPDQPLKIWGWSNSRFQASPSLPGLFFCSQQSLGKSQCQAGRMEMSNSGSWTSGLGDQCEQWGVSSGGWWVTHPTAWHQWATHSQEFPFYLFSLVLTSSRKKNCHISADSCGWVLELWGHLWKLSFYRWLFWFFGSDLWALSLPWAFWWKILNCFSSFYWNCTTYHKFLGHERFTGRQKSCQPQAPPAPAPLSFQQSLSLPLFPSVYDGDKMILFSW